MGGVHSVQIRSRRQGFWRRLGSPGARNPHAGKYREPPLWRQGGGGGRRPTPLPTRGRGVPHPRVWKGRRGALPLPFGGGGGGGGGSLHSRVRSIAPNI